MYSSHSAPLCQTPGVAASLKRLLASIPEIKVPKTKNQPQERLVIYIINQLCTRNSSGILLLV